MNTQHLGVSSRAAWSTQRHISKTNKKNVFQSKSSTIFLHHISTAWHSALLIPKMYLKLKIEHSHKHSFFLEFCLSQQCQINSLNTIVTEIWILSHQAQKSSKIIKRNLYVKCFCEMACRQACGCIFLIND